MVLVAYDIQKVTLDGLVVLSGLKLYDYHLVYFSSTLMFSGCEDNVDNINCKLFSERVFNQAD